MWEKLPDRDRLLANRWLKPFAHRLNHPLLWYFNRRSIARGLALGLFAGFILPVGQIALAALFALSVRANVVIAASATLVTNPVTFPPIYFAAYKLGSGFFGDRLEQMEVSQLHRTAIWLYGIAAPTALGLLLFAIITAFLGYGLVHLIWRLRVTQRWQRRIDRREEARFSQRKTPG